MTDTISTKLRDPIRVASVDELKEKGSMVVNGHDGPIAVFHHDDGQVHAVDNRCPHMGFPLHRGTIKDGILTATGTTRISTWRAAAPSISSRMTCRVRGRNPERRCMGFGFAGPVGRRGILAQPPEEGLEQNISLVNAKAVIALLKSGVSYKDIAETGGRYGVRYRSSGWGPGLTILTAMTNLCGYLPRDEQILPLYQGLTHVARDSNGQPPRFDLQPLDTENLTFEQLKRWFRRFVEVRDTEGATRCLLTAVSMDGDPALLVDMMMSAATDHVFLDGATSRTSSTSPRNCWTTSAGSTPVKCCPARSASFARGA